MCDDITQKDVDAYEHEKGVSRRKFNKLSATAAMAAFLPPVANAQPVSERDVEITTPDGVADCYFVYPSMGAHAAVLVWPHS